ncbi:MAG: glycosyltransferase family 2 protein [Elusimicrobiota bacterium]|jgi:glycosyltransferase involved in cell wall biosynthesis|nr:glycosyltransferase family 2 protein [Elusimicrobiota bacterium]
MKISIVAPVYNEYESLGELYRQIKQVCLENNYSYEIIFVDDGSTDASPSVIKDLAQEDSNISLIVFRKNFGKAAALQEGFNQASGDFIITMDADLQDDPAEIPNFIEKLKTYDLVCGWKLKRLDSIEKTLPSKLFNKTVSLLSGVKLHDFNCGFKAYRKEVIKAIDVYGEMHRYIPVIADKYGFKICEIPVHHRKRQFGKSKYGFERYLKGLFDCLTIVFTTKFMDKPMYFFGRVAIVIMGIGFLICLYLTILWLQGYIIGRRPLLLLGVFLILVGAQSFSIGLIAEMILKTTFRSNYQRYHVKEIFSLSKNSK